MALWAGGHWAGSPPSLGAMNPAHPMARRRGRYLAAVNRL